jgi:CRP-like cAMP-binding protein
VAGATRRRLAQEKGMSVSSLVPLLQSNPWFSTLATPHLEILAGLATEQQWLAGQVVFREGDRHQQVYVILEGRMALEIHVPNRGRVTILTVGPDEILGWSAAVPGQRKKTASARAMQDTRALAFDAAALAAACEANHDLGYHIYRWLTNVIAGRLTATRLQLLDMYAVDPEG